MNGFVPWVFVMAMMQMECESFVDSKLSITVAHKCPMPAVQGPVAPYWWRNIDMSRDKPPQAKPIKKKSKKKKRKKR